MSNCNSTELFQAAEQIQAAVDETNRLANVTGDKALRDLRRQVAGQLLDRADQVRSWARTTRYHEERGNDIPADVAFRIQSATREFLAMAEGK
jgi:hypothetical protein